MGETFRIRSFLGGSNVVTNDLESTSCHVPLRCVLTHIRCQTPASVCWRSAKIKPIRAACYHSTFRYQNKTRRMHHQFAYWCLHPQSLRNDGFCLQGHPRFQGRGYPCVIMLGGHTGAHHRPQMVAGICLGYYLCCLYGCLLYTSPSPRD